MIAPALEVEELDVTFDMGGRLLRAVRSLSFTVMPGEVVGMVGESGSGKSVATLAASRLLDPRRSTLRARRLAVAGHEVRSLSSRAVENLRGREIAYVFQDPLTSLNPVLTIGWQLTETLRRHAPLNRAEARREAADLLARVGIPGGSARLRQFPHQFSGGMRQRVMIAMALACRPKLLIADEPTTALDVTVQAGIVSLVRQIQARDGMAIVWVTHDLALLARLAARVVVMYAGRIVEDAPAAALYAAPGHPYTAGLLASTSRMDRGSGTQEPIPGHPPDPFADPQGCAFAPRCGRVDDVCQQERPTLIPSPENAAHRVACHHRLDGAPL